MASRIEELVSFRARVLNLSLNDRDAFCAAVGEAQAVLGATQADMAGWFRLSRTTVNRWAMGEAAPTRALRKLVLDAFAKRASTLQRQLSRVRGTEQAPATAREDQHATKNVARLERVAATGTVLLVGSLLIPFLSPAI